MTILIAIFVGVVMLYALGVAIGFYWKPKQPIALIGYVAGMGRLENGRGKDWYFLRDEWLIFFKPIQLSDDNNYAITHIQYKSPFGFYLAWPMCFYNWNVWRPQQIVPNPNAANDPANQTLQKPGTESGFIWRLPGWRWQGSNGIYILTKGQAGGHYD